ncbi:DUF2752 domain-containing protein [Anaerohalosphaeraceae bacterium U12dextr]
MAIFAGISGVWAFLWLAEKGIIHPQSVLGVCGFKQRYGLPCPGCGWTHSAQAFVTGDIRRSFVLQPAAMVFCVVSVIVWILALHTAVFGIHFRLWQVLLNPRFWKYVLICSGVVMLLGWVATLIRTYVGAF